MADNPPAFPSQPRDDDGLFTGPLNVGMTLRDWFAGQALSNPHLCDGKANEWQLSIWFGRLRTGINVDEIAARQAGAYADAMLAERGKNGAV